MRTGRPKRVDPPRYAHTSDEIALCVIGRRENRYAREFVAHYRSLGFDKIVICDNNHDGEERFSDVLGDYITDGYVDVLDYRGKSGVQRYAYGMVYARYGSKYRWIAFFDFDELMEIVGCGTIHELMLNYAGYECVLFNWRVYGDNGLVRDDGRPLRERFAEPLPEDIHIQYVEHPENDHVKCMVHGGLPSIHFYQSPHIPSTPLRCCNSCRERCKQSAFQKYDYSVAYLKHYATKTAEEWFSNKWHKGTGNKESIEAFRNIYAGRFFAYNEWTQEKDDVMREQTGMPPRKVPEHRTVVIINFNTQTLTEAAICSLNKHTPGCRIVVFDNSDKEPFRCGGMNVEVMDNTKGQLIDFEKFLAEYPDKYPCPENDWGSAKHCKTIDYCFELFPNGFLLMDSDVLVKQDVSLFFDASCAWTGNIEILLNRWNCRLSRVQPYICYLNVPMLLAHGVRYFNHEKMFALSHRVPDRWYDTGCWFYEECKRLGLPESYVNIDDYILHLRHGSWNSVKQGEWLEAHSELWK